LSTALPISSSNDELIFLTHSRSYGRLSALSMLGYFCIGPHVNIVMLDNPVILSLIFPAVGIGLTLLIALKPTWFQALCTIFAGYAVLVLYVTA
jgi:hypothetical protein